MGKGLALFGLILIIVGLLPIILDMVGFALPALTDLFYMLNLYTLDLGGGLVFTDLMLICLGLGVILLLVGAMR